jgi:SAM-dependent methyltransferase
MNPKIEILSDPAPFNMTDDWYQFSVSDHFWMQWRISRVRKLVDDFETGGRLLEVGCGSGGARDQLETLHGRPVDGCDLNLAALEMARPGQGKLYLYNIHERREPWKDYFSTIYMLDVLEHIPDTSHFLESVRFHLADDGLLILNVPAVQSLYSRYDEIQGHIKRYSISLVKKELSDAGFRPLKCSYWGFTMVPIIYLRKAVLRFTKEEKVVSRGFQPSSKVADLILRSLMYAERLLLQRPPLGTSIIAAARKI